MLMTLFTYLQFVVAYFAELHVHFAQFDKDGDGRITREELIGAMESLRFTPDADEVNSLLRAADADGQ